MLYFELVPALSMLDDGDAGALFKALMAYAQYGEVRDLTGSAEIAFQMMRGRIDRDSAAYQEKCRKSAYAAYVRDTQRQGEIPLEYEAWCSRSSDDIGRYPTTTTNTIPNTVSNTNAVSNTTAIQRQPNRSSAPPPAADSDTSWVLPYLEERNQNRKRSLAR